MRKFLLTAILFGTMQCAVADAPKFIDTQAQFDPVNLDYRGSVEVMLKEMDRVGISKILIVPPVFPGHHPRLYDAEAIVKAIGSRKDRFGFLGGATLNATILETPANAVTAEIKARFRARCEEILALGALGFGEVTAEHLSLPLMKQGGLNHFHNAAPPDHPLLLLLADIAAEKDVPIDIHFDIFPRTIPTPPQLREGNQPELKENQAAFERLLSHNPKARFNWAHLGGDPAQQRTPQLMRTLLTRHPNLYSAFRVDPRPSGFAGFALNEAGNLKPEWRQLIEDFSDRFTVHSDIFYVPSWPPPRGSKTSHESARRLLEQLPPELARKLAHENAQRIYKIKE